MQILYLLIGLIGLIMLFFGAKWLLRSKTVVKFTINKNIKEFKIGRSGVYAVCFMETRFFNNFGVFHIKIINSDNQERIDMKKNFLKWRFIKNWKKGVEYYQFKIQNAGNYRIEIDQANKSIHNIEVLIKESVTVSKKIFGILFLVFGVNISFWGIILAINPNPFG